MVRKVIILSAVTGGQLPSANPNLPLTPDQIADAIVDSWKAGASMAHYHTRDPKTGRPATNLQVFREVATRVKAKCDIVLCPTTGGGGGTIAERLAMVPDLQPETATFDLGPISGGAYRRLKRYKDNPKYPWEREYMERGRSHCDPRTYERLANYCKVFAQYDTKPELEIFSPRDIDYIAWMAGEGLLQKPLCVQFVMTARLATMDYLFYLYRTARQYLGEFNFRVAAAGAGKLMDMIAVGVALGGDARVGLEDALRFRHNGIVEPSKGSTEQVAAARKIIEGMGYEIATPNDAREMLALKGLDKVNF